MCLIVFAYRSVPGYRLILAANRDEFYNRPTRPLACWDDASGILAGRDIKAGGTWLGITRAGRIAAITNYREVTSNREDAPSRGDLVRDFLIGNSTPQDYLKTVRDKGQAYNGFNLIVGDTNDLLYFSNKNENIRYIRPGVHGLSNHLLDTPWPKVIQGTSRFYSWMNEKKDFSTEDIFTLLADPSTPSDEELPNTGVGLEWERILSPIFITSDIYGTRCSSIILWTYAGQITFLERTYDKQAQGKFEVTTRRNGFTLTADR
ncbi:MAG: NRDE family protein [Deltaproteobacteria bacterium]|nr:NRDE family protein [Deltaproteobacteria bacterium]